MTATDAQALHKDFVKRLHSLDRSKSEQERFREFCELAFCALAKTTAAPDRAEALDARYADIVSRCRSPEDEHAYGAMLAITYRAMQWGEDFLGPIACEIGALDQHAGQYFTPTGVARLTAAMTIGDATPLI